MSNYKDDIDKMRWSYSKLTSFEHCKYEFFLKYIVNDKITYPIENNFYAEVGSYVHEILAKIFNRELAVDEAAQYYVDNFDINVLQKTKETTMDRTFEQCANYFAEADFDWLNAYEILGVEMEVKFRLKDYNFIGYIDLLLKDKKDNEIIVFDNKSSKYPFRLDGKVKAKSEHSFENYKKQMYLYSHAVMNKYGKFPKEITWNHFKDGGRFATIPFVKSEYDRAVKWSLDTIHSIENEQDFEPNEDFFYCHNLCNFRHSCEYAKGDI